MNRVTFIIDGFNLYHSVRKAEWELSNEKIHVSTKWLDIKKLCESYLHAIGHLVGDKAVLKNVYYFSALAHHLEETDPDITIRHKSFIKILKDTGILVELGRFKAKKIKCRLCQNKLVKHEEKETDVAIALKLLEVFIADESVRLIPS